MNISRMEFLRSQIIQIERIMSRFMLLALLAAVTWSCSNSSSKENPQPGSEISSSQSKSQTATMPFVGTIKIKTKITLTYDEASSQTNVSVSEAGLLVDTTILSNNIPAIFSINGVKALFKSAMPEIGYYIDDTTRSYLEVDFEKAFQLIKGHVRAAAEASLKNSYEEARKYYKEAHELSKQIFGDDFYNSQAKFSFEGTAKVVGKETVLGFLCDHISIVSKQKGMEAFASGLNNIDVWITSDLGIDYNVFDKIHRRNSQF